jgi:hypothetical protein
MRHLRTILALAIVAAAIVACKNKPNTGNLPVVNTNKLKSAEGDSTQYGTCVDATSNTVSILTNNGDTVQYVCADVYDDDGNVINQVVKGGVFTGDRVAIVGKIGEEENLASNIINLTSLMGRWTSLDRDFEIKDGGVVESRVEAETNPYTSWHIFNGKLILSKDTFDVCELGSDSLILENSRGIFGYKRK